MAASLRRRGRTGGSSVRFAGDAYFVADFPGNTAKKAGVTTTITNISGWSFARASAGFALNSAGVYVPFASGVPRITDRGFLIEGARTNLVLQSQDFSNAAWTKTAATVTTGQLGPDAKPSACLITGTGSGEVVGTASAFTVTSASTYTCYWIVKRGNADWFYCGVADTTSFTNTIRAWFNIATGTLGATSSGGTGYGFVSKSIQALADGWYLCSIVCTAPTTTMAMTSSLVAADSSTARADVGSGAGVGTTRYQWIAQAELGTGPSSPIVTTGSSATRAADVASVTISQAYPLTLYVKAQRDIDTGAVQNLLQTDAGNDNERVLIDIPANDIVRAVMTAGGVGQATPQSGGALAVGATTRAAARFNSNSVQIAVDGSLATEDTSATLPTTATTLRLGMASGSAQAYSYIQRVAVINGAYTNTQLQALTT